MKGMMTKNYTKHYSQMESKFFENTTYFDLLTLIKLIHDSEEKKNTFIERGYITKASNYSEVKEFLKELRLLRDENGRLNISLKTSPAEE